MQCTPISGATGQTYSPTSTDVGKYIVAIETADDGTGATATKASNILGPVTATPPTNNTGPTIAGTPAEHQPLTETAGAWTGDQSVTVRWERCADNSTNNCTAITGAPTTPGSSYTLTFADVGHYLVVVETADDGTGATATKASNIRGPITAVAPTNTAAPSISGSGAQGQTLDETAGNWTGQQSVAVEWERCTDSAGTQCTVIPGATNQTYTLTPDDANDWIVAVETADDGSGAKASKASNSIGKVTTTSSTLVTVQSGPAAPATNQLVTLGAMITSASGNAPPSGLITFYNHGTPIGGCHGIRVPASAQSVTVTCQTSFRATDSQAQLSAIFTPDAGSVVGGSTSGVNGVSIVRDATSTSLGFSKLNVTYGSSETFFAILLPTFTGPAAPSGTVEFVDSGVPIGSCARQPIFWAGAAYEAICTVTYNDTAVHLVTAVYSGDNNFTGSTSSFPANIAIQPDGTIKAPIRHNFTVTPSGTKVVTLLIQGVAAGSNVIVQCHGRGCPYARTTVAVKHHKTVNLGRRFANRQLRPGAKINVYVVRPGWLGKSYVFKVRPKRQPKVTAGCLAPGTTQPAAC
jgi:hypothetical protein